MSDLNSKVTTTENLNIIFVQVQILAMAFMESSFDFWSKISLPPFLRSSGQQPNVGVGVHNSDLLGLDRSLEPRNKKFAICLLDN